MKKPSSGLGVGLWVVGVILGLYFGVLGLILADAAFFRGYYFRQFPQPVLSALEVTYRPIRLFVEAISHP